MDPIGLLFHGVRMVMAANWSTDLAFIGLFLGVGAWIFGSHDHKGLLFKTILSSCVMFFISSVFLWIQGL